MFSDFRLNFSSEVFGALDQLAQKQCKTIAEMIESLTLSALDDQQEDMKLASMADAIDMNAERISHNDLWQKF